MPGLACRTCGRRIYTVAPLESLFAEERRCPRCGANLDVDRRRHERRQALRRTNAVDDPGPPPTGAEQDATDRRTTDRRTTRRRRPEDGENRPGADGRGWQD